MSKFSGRYRCKTSLCEFSRTIASPFILICVDIANHAAYWRQITPNMPEYQKRQGTFTIHFAAPEDQICNTSSYPLKWRQMVDDYQGRITAYPELKNRHDAIVMPTIPEHDKQVLTAYVERINTLLSHDFPVIKNQMFPGVDKLGLGIYSATGKSCHFELFKIAYGEKKPLVYFGKGEGFSQILFDLNIHSIQWIPNSPGFEPLQQANKFVFDLVKDFVLKQQFHVHGRFNSMSILFHFIDHYPECFNLKAGRTKYDVTQMSRGFYARLMRHYSICAVGFYEKYGEPPVFNLDTFARSIEQHHRTTVEEKNSTILTNKLPSFHVKARSEPPNFNSFVECLAFIKSQNISEIERNKSFANPHGLFLRDKETAYIRHLFENSICEYECFVHGNDLVFRDSPYLSHSISILFVYTKIKNNDALDSYRIDEFHFNNPDGKLPKIYVKTNIPATKQPAHHDGRTSNIIVDKIKFGTYCKAFWGCNVLPFSQTPQLDLIYYMLRNDLKTHYGIDINDSQYKSLTTFYDKLLYHMMPEK